MAVLAGPHPHFSLIVYFIEILYVVECFCHIDIPYVLLLASSIFTCFRIRRHCHLIQCNTGPKNAVGCCWQKQKMENEETEPCANLVGFFDPLCLCRAHLSPELGPARLSLVKLGLLAWRLAEDRDPQSHFAPNATPDPGAARGAGRWPFWDFFGASANRSVFFWDLTLSKSTTLNC